MNVPQAPLFEDPEFHGPADPTVFWNHHEAEWWMLYTVRRATLEGGDFVNANPIGIATSKDGREWVYQGHCRLEPVPFQNTFWAPCVFREGDTYHLFVSFIEGAPPPWEGDRHIVHYTGTTDLKNGWKRESTLDLDSNRVIDPGVAKIGGTYYMWYKDEDRDSQTLVAVSDDLHHWKVQGQAFRFHGHEAPMVFEWKGFHWLIADAWSRGLRLWRSKDGRTWEAQPEPILLEAGRRKDDEYRGGHPHVLVNGGRAFIFYHVHPGYAAWEGKVPSVRRLPFSLRRTVIQVAELEAEDGWITCDRDRPFDFVLIPPID